MDISTAIELFELSKVDVDIWKNWPRQINECWTHALIVPADRFDAMRFFVAPYVVDFWQRSADEFVVLLNAGRKLFAVSNGILCDCFAAVSSRDAARKALLRWASVSLSPITTVCEMDANDPTNPRIYQTAKLAAGITLTVQSPAAKGA